MRFDSIHLRPYRQVEFTSIFDEMTRFEAEQTKCRSGDDRVLLNELSHRLKSKNVDGRIAI